MQNNKYCTGMSRTILSKRGKSEHPFVVPDPKVRTFVLSSLSMMLALKFFIGASYKVEKIPFNSYIPA